MSDWTPARVVSTLYDTARVRQAASAQASRLPDLKTGDDFETFGEAVVGDDWRWIMVKRGNVAGWAAIEKADGSLQLFDYELIQEPEPEPELPRSGPGLEFGVTLPGVTVIALSTHLQNAAKYSHSAMQHWQAYVDMQRQAAEALNSAWTVLKNSYDEIEIGG